MPLRFNNTEIMRVFLNGVEKMALKYNGTGYFGKRFALIKNTSTGVTLTVNRTSSPYQHAAIGAVSTGNTIYYGDVLTITCMANSGYTNPQLYVDTGNGMMLMTSPYSFSVTGNISFYGTALQSNTWYTVWSGSETVSNVDSFTVPGLDDSNSQIQVTANIIFGQWLLDQASGEQFGYEETIVSINRSVLPKTVYGLYASMNLKRQGSKIIFTAQAQIEDMKSYFLVESPVRVELTEVRSNS